MSMSNAGELGLQLLMFNNTAFAGVGDSTGLKGSDTAGSYFVSLHTADPTDAGDQTSFETTYTSYARVGVVRATSGWTVTNANAANSTTVTFPLCSGGSNTVTHFGVGASSSSTGILLWSAALNSALAISNGITPSFSSGLLDIDLE